VNNQRDRDLTLEKCLNCGTLSKCPHSGCWGGLHEHPLDVGVASSLYQYIKYCYHYPRKPAVTPTIGSTEPIVKCGYASSAVSKTGFGGKKV
jgi:hypothetical protein